MNEGIQPTPSGYSMGIDIDKPTPPAPNDPSESGKRFMQTVPEAFASKEWVGRLATHEDPMTEMFKQFDNQISLVGRKAEGLRLPGDNATAEDWSSFYKSIGVPESADKYEYKSPEVPEHLKQYWAQDEAFLTTMREAALKAGVRPEGFKHLAEAFDKFYLNELQSQVDGMNSNLKTLENNFKQKFGDRSDQVLDNWSKSLPGGLSPEQIRAIESLDPSVKVVLAEQFDNFSKKYIREDSLDLEVPRASNAMNVTDYGDEYARLFAKMRQAAPGSPDFFEAKRSLEQLQSRGRETLFKK